ncbi:MAG: 6-pyruvoyl tetrahydropterin synthase family protein [Pirellulales bacterium]
MTQNYHVRLAKEQFTFSAAHFITFAGNICERLHGHNYHVAVEVHGLLDENQYVIDFIALRDAVLAITRALDHHVLLPTTHPTIKIEADDREVTVTFEERRWVFPLDDCVLLPVANTTAELVARYIGERLIAGMQPKPEKLIVSVDECDGQQGVCAMS